MDEAGVLALLQLADSGFPSGAYVLSHGLETLAADGWVRDAGDLAQVVAVLLRDRAAKAELPILLAAHRLGGGPGHADASGDVRRGATPPVVVVTSDADAPDATLQAIAVVDRRLETVKLAPDERAGSARVGRRLLVEGARLYPASAVPGYGAVVRRGLAPGHAAVAQGLVFAAAGVPGRAAALAAASGLASGVLTAAMRLGLIGHGDAQRLLLEAGPAIMAAVAYATAADPSDLRPSAPMLDIAVARHARADVRVFAS